MKNREDHTEKMCCPIAPTPPMLVNEIARLFHARMRASDIEDILTQDSVRLIMRALVHIDGCSQLDLVRHTRLKAPTVSVAVDRLEARGWVCREQNTSDLRCVKVCLTEKGKEHNRSIRERLNRMDAKLMEGFSEEETEQLLGYLARMRDNILSDPSPKHT